MLVDMGVAPLEIAERLGHEKVETTLNTYSHLYPSTPVSYTHLDVYKRQAHILLESAERFL